MNSIWSLNEAVNLAFMGEKQVLKSVSRGLSTRKPNASELNKPGPSNASKLRKHHKEVTSHCPLSPAILMLGM